LMMDVVLPIVGTIDFQTLKQRSHGFAFARKETARFRGHNEAG